MGRNSGGIKSNAGKGSGGIKKGATEQGYTAKMVRNIVGIEQRYRNNADETMCVFSPTGDIVISVGGKGAEVDYGKHKSKIPADSIITHNHPRSIGQTGIRAIGNSFSARDIYSAVDLNAREIRAVTPTYTFSVKRPKGGWGASAQKVANDFSQAHNEVKQEMVKYLNGQKWSADATARAETTHYHKVMQKMAKKYGWNYTKKRG